MNRIAACVVSALSLIVISCGGNASGRIKKENLEITKKRKAEYADKIPEMTFEKTEHDFGNINEGDIVKTSFKFKNTGKGPLIILSVQKICGCTTPTYPKEPIQPGEEKEIVVEFNSSGKPGKQNKTITMTTNTEDVEKRVNIKAFVKSKTSK